VSDTLLLVTPAQYFATRFEREPEYVHGELVERSAPNLSNGIIRARLALILDGHGYACLSLTMQLAEDLFRIADAALFEVHPKCDYPKTPPVLVVEIASGDDRVRVERKLPEYQEWGVANICLVDPELKKLYVYDGGLIDVSKVELPALSITITPEQLFGNWQISDVGPAPLPATGL
jgi:Uma2 family endonuclease